MRKPFVIRGDRFDTAFKNIRWSKKQRLGSRIRDQGFVLCSMDYARLFAADLLAEDRRDYIAIYNSNLPMYHKNSHVLILPQAIKGEEDVE